MRLVHLTMVMPGSMIRVGRHGVQTTVVGMGRFGEHVSGARAAWCQSWWGCGLCKSVGAVRCLWALCLFGMLFVSGVAGGAVILGG